LGASIWSKDKKAEGASEDREGLKSLYRTVDRLIEIASAFE
ncbi:flavodoxin family protein, partial [Methanosarcinales archaeon]